MISLRQDLKANVFSCEKVLSDTILSQMSQILEKGDELKEFPFAADACVVSLLTIQFNKYHLVSIHFVQELDFHLFICVK